MTKVDWIIASLALLCFAASLAVIPLWVPLPDLIIVCAVAILMAAYDFARPLLRRASTNNRTAPPRQD